MNGERVIIAMHPGEVMSRGLFVRAGKTGEHLNRASSAGREGKREE